MSYQSPLHIIDSFQTDLQQLNQEEIVRLRKKLLAEFNLTGETTITINGKEFTKDDIIQQIDALKNIEDFDTHIQIYKNKEVVTFCENPKKSKNPLTAITVSFTQPETTEKYKSIVLEAEMVALKYHLINYDYNKVHFIQQFLYKINFEGASEAFNILNEQLMHLSDFLNSVNKNNFHLEAAKLKKFLNNAYFYRFINELPVELVQLKTSIIVSLINLTTRINALNKSFTCEISWNLTSLDCEERHRNLIESNHQVYTGTSTSTGSNSSGNSEEGELSTMSIIRIVGLILYILYRIIN